MFIKSTAIRVALCASLIALIVSPGLAQRKAGSARIRAMANMGPEAKVDQLVRTASAGKNTKALYVAIVEHGKIVYSKGFGDAGNGRPPTIDTVFYIGSLSKAVTGFGLMELMDRGKVSLRTPVGRYIPGLPGNWSSTPLLNYVTHTSGLPNVPKSASFEKAVEKVAGEPLAFPPGTTQSYNNFNFAIAGRVIENVSGQSYLDYMKQNVFDPCGMASTGVGITNKLTQVSRYPNVEAYGTPSGGLESSTGDLVRWFQYMAHQRGMNTPAYRAMYTPLVPTQTKRNTPWHFTPGWQARFANGDEIVGKNGGVVGFESMMQMVPPKGICVIILQSHEGPGKGATELWGLTADILQAVYGYPKKGGQGEGDSVQ